MGTNKLFPKLDQNYGKNARTRPLLPSLPLIYLSNHRPLHLLGMAEQTVEKHGSPSCHAATPFPRVPSLPLTPTGVCRSAGSIPGPPQARSSLSSLSLALPHPPDTQPPRSVAVAGSSPAPSPAPAPSPVPPLSRRHLPELTLPS